MVGPEELTPIVHHSGLIGCQARQLFLVTQIVDDLSPQARPTAQGSVGIPDELAVQLPGGGEHGQLPDSWRQGSIFPQVSRQLQPSLRHESREMLGEASK